MIHVNPDALEFHIQTQQSSYVIKVIETDHLVNLHFGKRIEHRNDLSSLDRRFNIALGSTTAYSKDSGNLTLETMRLEAPVYGKGDYRTPMLHLEYEDGSRTSDFVFDRYELSESKPELSGLPQSFGNAETSASLTVVLKEPVKKLELHLHYSAYHDANVITRSCELKNLSEQTIVIDQALSACIDFIDDDFELLHLNGKWINEAQLVRQPVTKGVFQIDSKKGVSGANHNPFLCLARPGCSELMGECYGLGLVYSGNHQCSVEVSPHNLTRAMLGINPFDFRWPLAAGESFAMPEVALTYSDDGLNGMSQSFHAFVQNHLTNSYWAKRERPVQVNNWEATYFDFNQSKLLKLAKKARSLGVEMFVLDDGWFGARNSDETSLGDFFENVKKLPGGLAGLSKKIRSIGLEFGIWVEPEMISVDSELYRKHPEWAVQLPDRNPSFGRNQLVLDMANPEVVDYLFEQLCDVFSKAEVSYVKWDHNRNFSDIYSSYLAREQQGAFAHRYVLGLYQLLDRLTKAFPEILFESCSSGGNRFDLGMLRYMPQTWTSDNTDAVERMSIQYGTSMLYPPSSMSAHVSGRPSHQVLRNTPIETRFNVAAFGLLGYQLDLTKLTSFESKAVVAQIEFYKEHRKLLQFGRFYRLESPFESNRVLWIVVSEDGREAMLGYYQKLQQSNGPLEVVRLPMLNDDDCYEINSRDQFCNIRVFGDLVNEQLPVDIKDRGVIHGVLANHYMHQLPKESFKLYGDQISAAGLPLKAQFAGTEMTDEVRYIGDFGSRLYYFKAE